MKKIIVIIFTSIVIFSQTRVLADDPAYFDITFSNIAWGGTTVGTGWISGSLISPGTYEIFDGAFTIASGDGLDAGTYSLLPNPNPPDQSQSPSGYFLFDNQVSPDAIPYVNNLGLLFGAGNIEINLYSNAGNIPQYQLYENTGANVLGDASIIPVPEPSTLILLMPFGIMLWLLRLKHTT